MKFVILNGRDTTKNRRFMALRKSALALLFVGVWVLEPAAASAQQKSTGGASQTNPQCKAEYEACARKCDQTIIDIDNNVQNCKNKCRSDTDLFCSRTLTGGGKGAVPKAPVTGGTLQRK